MKKKLLNIKFQYILLIIPILIFSIRNVKLDNDIWFILNHGRYVFENGIPYVEPFTIHEGLSFVMQQWGTALLFWIIFNYLGEKAFFLFLVIVGLLVIITFYKLCKLNSNNMLLSIILSILLSFCLKAYIVSRPQIFTYLILIIELYFLEKYTITKNKKSLYILPLLSLILINMHASVWFFQFLFILPFIINGVKFRKFKLGNYKLKPILVCSVFMFFAGFINPYGYKAITYIFNSYGVWEVSDYIAEMKYLNFSNINCKILLLCLFFMIFLLNFNKKRKVELRHIFLLFGTLIIAFMQNKGLPYFFIIYFYVISYYFKNINLTFFKHIKNKYLNTLIFGLKIGVYFMLVCTLIFIMYNSFCELKYDNYLKDSVEVLIEESKSADIRLYVKYEFGGYTEYMGIKSYIDPRAEVFLKKNNNKEDIFIEYYELSKKDNFDYEDFINKYQFTHFLVSPNEKIDKYLSNNKNYKLIFEDTDEDYEGVIAKVYKNINGEQK